jgi:hypothetical protein
VDGSKKTITPLLDAQLLHTYEERLRAQGLPFDEWVRPGLRGDEMDTVLAPLGLRLPSEARTWWGWHDGENPTARNDLLGPSTEFLSLAESVRQYGQSRGIAERTAKQDPPPWDDPDFAWNPAWLPISRPGHPVVIDCSVAEDDPTPIRYIDWQNVDSFFLPKAQSLGQMVTWWIEAIDVGAWEWSHKDQRWFSHNDRLEPPLKFNVLV